MGKAKGNSFTHYNAPLSETFGLHLQAYKVCHFAYYVKNVRLIWSMNFLFFTLVEKTGSNETEKTYIIMSYRICDPSNTG
jgi:hypothetical protein